MELGTTELQTDGQTDVKVEIVSNRQVSVIYVDLLFLGKIYHYLGRSFAISSKFNGY